MEELSSETNGLTKPQEARQSMFVEDGDAPVCAV